LYNSQNTYIISSAELLMLVSYSVAACFEQLCGCHLSTLEYKSKITIASFILDQNEISFC